MNGRTLTSDGSSAGIHLSLLATIQPRPSAYNDYDDDTDWYGFVNRHRPPFWICLHSSDDVQRAGRRAYEVERSGSLERGVGEILGCQSGTSG